MIYRSRGEGWLTGRWQCRVRILGGDYCVIRSKDIEDDEVPMPFRFVRSQIAGWVHDALVWPVLLEMCEVIFGTDHPNPTLMGIPWLQHRLEDAFEKGRLLLVTEGVKKKPKGGGGGGAEDSTPQSSSADPTKGSAPPPPAEPPKEPVKTWFRARLLDEDGDPMANEDYLLVDSDGVKRSGKLDAQGEVYIPPILPPGKCTISFPKIHLNPLKR